MESRNFHGTISELINPRPSAVNRESYYENEELQTQIFALNTLDYLITVLRVLLTGAMKTLGAHNV